MSGVSRSSTVRLTMALSILIVSACLALGGVLVSRDRGAIERGLLDRGETISRFLAREAELSVLRGDRQALRRLAGIAQGERDVLHVAFYDETHTALISLGTPPMDDLSDVQDQPTLHDTMWIFTAPILATATDAGAEEREPLGKNRDGKREEKIGHVVVGLGSTPFGRASSTPSSSGWWSRPSSCASPSYAPSS